MSFRFHRLSHCGLDPSWFSACFSHTFPASLPLSGERSKTEGWEQVDCPGWLHQGLLWHVRLLLNTKTPLEWGWSRRWSWRRVSCRCLPRRESSHLSSHPGGQGPGGAGGVLGYHWVFIFFSTRVQACHSLFMEFVSQREGPLTEDVWFCSPRRWGQCSTSAQCNNTPVSTDSWNTGQRLCPRVMVICLFLF